MAIFEILFLILNDATIAKNRILQNKNRTKQHKKNYVI